MVVVRNSFQLKFGKAKDALAAIREAIGVQKKAGSSFSYRILTDLTGPFYTLVLEITVPNMAALEADMPRNMSLPEFQTAYQKFVQFVECGERQIFTVVE